MKTFIALFRGINVVGSKMLPMAALKALVEQHGCVDVRTYIQSGNVVFRSDTADAARLGKQVAAAVSRDHGFEPRVMVLTRSELQKAAAGNPFPEAEDDPRKVHLFFLADAAKKADLKGLQALATQRERWVLKGKVFYLHTPEGFGTSKVAARAERFLGVDATARNWRTVTTLLGLAASPED